MRPRFVRLARVKALLVGEEALHHGPAQGDHRARADASAIIDAQYDDQRRGMEALARKLHQAGRLRKGWSVSRATAALHALTSVETFTLLRRDHGLRLAKVKQTILELSCAVLSEKR